MHTKIIYVATTTGDMPVSASVFGALGVHPHIGSFDQWAITHVATRFRLKGVYPSRDAAEAAAIELAALGNWDDFVKQSLIDEAYRDALIGVARTISARHGGVETTTPTGEAA